MDIKFPELSTPLAHRLASLVDFQNAIPGLTTVVILLLGYLFYTVRNRMPFVKEAS